MVYSGQVGQTSYPFYMQTAVPGTIMGMGPYRALPYLHTASAVQGVYTIAAPSSVDATTTYSVTIDGITVSVTSGGSTTQAQLGTLLYNALRQNAQVYRLADISDNGSGTVTLTARKYNTALTITSPTNASTTNDLTIATSTSPGTAASIIPYGRFVGTLSSYSVDPISGVSPAALISHASNFTVRGITMKSFHEKNAIGPDAAVGYPEQSVMSVLSSCVGIQGIWVECVESTITPASSCYIAISGSNAGKATSTSSSNADISAKAKFITNAVQYRDTYIVGVYFDFHY